MENMVQFSKDQIRVNYRKKIEKALSFEEAYLIKEKMEREGLSVSPKTYFELLLKCNNPITMLQLKKEMEENDISFSEMIYIIFIKKESNFSKRLLLLEEMESKGIKPTIKTYFVIIKNEKDFHKALFIFNRMKLNYIEPDERIYNEIHRKSLGHPEYHSLQEEIKNYKFVRGLVINFLSYTNLDDAISYAISEGRITDIYTVNKLLNRIDNHGNRMKLLNSSLEEGFELHHLSYWYCLKKAAQEGMASENKTALKRLFSLLSEAERQKLTEKFNKELCRVGGKGKYYLDIGYKIEALHKEAYLTADDSSFFYLQGKAVGLDLYFSVFEEELRFIEDIKDSEDMELYKYELIKSKGVYAGMELKRKILENWQAKEVPMLVIVYMEDLVILQDYYNYSITQGFYPYDLQDVNSLNISGCLFTNSISELKKITEAINFDHYDVSINIFFYDGNNEFFKKNPDSEDWLQATYPKNKAMMPRFLRVNDDYQKNLESTFSMLCNSIAF